MRRIIKVSSALILLLLLLTGGVSAAETPMVSVGDVAAKPGESVELVVQLENNPGLAGFLIYIECDTDVFHLEYDNELGSYAVERGAVTAAGTLLCNKDKTNTGWSVMWYNLENVQTDGSLFTLTLQVDANAAVKDYELGIKYAAGSTVNEAGEKVGLTVSGGTIKVLSKAASISCEGAAVSAPGNRYDLSVMLDANPGFAGMMVEIDCDVACFSPLMASDGETYRIEQGNIAEGGTLVCVANGDKGFRVILWFVEANAVNTGTLFTLPLQVSETAELGDYHFELNVTDLTNVEGENVPVSSVIGSVVELKMLDIDNVSMQAAGSKTNILVDTNCLHTKQPVMLVAALYSSQDQMLGCDVKTVTGSGTAEQFTLTIARAAPDGAKIKLFAMIPNTYEALIVPWPVGGTATDE